MGDKYLPLKLTKEESDDLTHQIRLLLDEDIACIEAGYGRDDDAFRLEVYLAIWRWVEARLNE